MSEKACCSVARTLDPKRLAKLDVELRDPKHRSFAKLSAAYGVPRSGIEKHKKVCLGIGVPKPHLDPASIPKPEPVAVRVDTSKASKNTSMDGGLSGLDVQDSTQTRAPVSAICATSRQERVAWLVQEILGRRPDDLFDPAREVGRLADLWKLGETAVREYVRAAEDVIALNAGDVRSAKVQAAIDTRAVRDAAIKAGDYAAANAAQKELNRLTGAVDDGKNVTINVVQSPAFMAMVDAALTALVPFPDARRAVTKAWTQAAKELQQPEPTVLLTTGEELPE